MHRGSHAMNTRISIVVALVLPFLTACSPQRERWSIEFFDTASRSLGSVVLEVTPKAEASCTGQVADVQAKTMHPADTGRLASVGDRIGDRACLIITPTSFSANLNLGSYDNNTNVIGDRSGDQAKGIVSLDAGPGGLIAGTFRAHRLLP